MKRLAMLAATTLLSCSALAAPNTSSVSSQFSEAQVKEIQTLVRNYLITNPDVLVEASQVLQQQEITRIEEQAKTGIVSHKDALFNSKNDPVLGNALGTVTLVEFMDYQCPHCKSMSPVIDDLIKKNPNLKVVIKEWPILGENSMYAAKAALAAAQQGKYVELREKLVETKDRLSPELIIKMASDVGLDTVRLKKEMEDTSIDKLIQDNYNLAKTLALVGTPAFVVANKDGSKTEFVPGTSNSEQLQALITKVNN